MPTRKGKGTPKPTRTGSRAVGKRGRAASSRRAKRPGTAARASGTRKKVAGKSTAGRGARAKAGKSVRGRTSRAPRSRAIAASEPEATEIEIVEIDIIEVEPPVVETGMLLVPEEDLLEELESEGRESPYGQAGVETSEEDQDSEAGLAE